MKEHGGNPIEKRRSLAAFGRVPQWQGEPSAAYAEVVMGQPRKRRTQPAVASRIGLLALLFALLITQAASSVCGVQCVEHQFPCHNHAMHHCASMRNAPPATNGAGFQTCLPGVHSYCAVDLLANSQARAIVLASSTIPSGTLLRPQDKSSTPARPALRSSPGSSPPITALRI